MIKESHCIYYCW